MKKKEKGKGKMKAGVWETKFHLNVLSNAESLNIEWKR